MSVFFSVGSLFLGIISWAIPIIAMGQSKKGKHVKHFSIYSFGACSTALILQLFELKNRTNLEDWSAIMDTIGAVCSVSIFLVVVTFVLNIIASSLCSERE